MKIYKMLVKEFLAGYVNVQRKGWGLTQEEMAERLRITSRAYGDLERGKYCFSALALLSLLIMLSDDEVRGLLADFRAKILALEEDMVA